MRAPETSLNHNFKDYGQPPNSMNLNIVKILHKSIMDAFFGELTFYKVGSRSKFLFYLKIQLLIIFD